MTEKRPPKPVPRCYARDGWLCPTARLASSGEAAGMKPATLTSAGSLRHSPDIMSVLVRRVTRCCKRLLKYGEKRTTLRPLSGEISRWLVPRRGLSSAESSGRTNSPEPIYPIHDEPKQSNSLHFAAERFFNRLSSTFPTFVSADQQSQIRSCESATFAPRTWTNHPAAPTRIALVALHPSCLQFNFFRRLPSISNVHIARAELAIQQFKIIKPFFRSLIRVVVHMGHRLVKFFRRCNLCNSGSSFLGAMR
ncbi:hypothetical protein ETAA8_58360 [Anatilimnocola aggregata]|uniref:Uncharacterized protein n=1 Tax=Anatilimnocola aggregata TaxID=2528021 RepID=A0A517YKD9_9BACT|nr:hypothetical protein ETAA8_58360 [Anatilimnocola aggregata]